MKLRLVLFVATLVAAAAASVSVAADVAKACDTNYWNVSCSYYPPSTGHSRTVACCGDMHSIYTTFDPYDTDLGVMATAGGSWEWSQLLYYGWTVHGYSYHFTDKGGCYNHH